mmetsp:Transcript_38628/g.83995  ORF Transcript_38628/g.83995 Transcript_38628/m.83995 type:complete len:246 (-) Transcript_38628:317-1054(-)
MVRGILFLLADHLAFPDATKEAHHQPVHFRKHPRPACAVDDNSLCGHRGGSHQREVHQKAEIRRRFLSVRRNRGRAYHAPGGDDSHFLRQAASGRRLPDHLHHARAEVPHPGSVAQNQPGRQRLLRPVHVLLRAVQLLREHALPHQAARQEQRLHTLLPRVRSLHLPVRHHHGWHVHVLRVLRVRMGPVHRLGVPLSVDAARHLRAAPIFPRLLPHLPSHLGQERVLYHAHRPVATALPAARRAD